MSSAFPQIHLVRHGETAWSLSGQHTGRTDIPLTPAGEAAARGVADRLKGLSFSAVWSSPSQRAYNTSVLAGFGAESVRKDDLQEWDYGAYEGRTTQEIQRETPGWSVWTSPMIDGETINQVAERANRVIARAAARGGHVALFAHGHILRILAACWIQMPPVTGSRLALGTGTVSVLGYEHETRVISEWNRDLD